MVKLLRLPGLFTMYQEATERHGSREAVVRRDLVLNIDEIAYMREVGEQSNRTFVYLKSSKHGYEHITVELPLDKVLSLIEEFNK